MRISSSAVILSIFMAIPTDRPGAAGIPVVFTQIRAETAPRNLRPFGSRGLTIVSRVSLLRDDGTVVPLTAELSAARDPDVSFDGASVLVSGRRKPQDRWGIYETSLDGSHLTLVADLPEDCLDPIYLPDGRVLFSSVTAKGRRPEAALFACRPGGSELQRLTFHAGLDLDASLLKDGRVLFTNWRWDERSLRWIGRFFTINSDGTGVAAIRRSEQGADGRETPDGRIAFVSLEGAATDGGGALAALGMRRIEDRISLAGSVAGRWRSPFPMPDGDILAARAVDQPGVTYGLWRWTASGILPVYDDPLWHDMDPVAVLPRPVPMGHLSITDLRKTKGVLYCLDATFPDGGRKPVTLRVVAGPGRRIVGYAPVESDGSFAVEVPADVPLSLEVLDSDGAPVHGASKSVWVRPNETRGCAGCHEDRDLAPENRRPIALMKPPVALRKGPRTMDDGR